MKIFSCIDTLVWLHCTVCNRVQIREDTQKSGGFSGRTTGQGTNPKSLVVQTHFFYNLFVLLVNGLKWIENAEFFFVKLKFWNQNFQILFFG